MYLDGMKVAEIADKFDRSRWGVYLILREAGIDTSLSFRGRKVIPNSIQRFLAEEWMDSDIGRSPTAIARHLDVKLESVHAVLRNRRQALHNRARKIPMAEMFAGFTYYVPDPYRMLVRFHGSTGSEESVIELTSEEMEDAIRQMQDLK